MQISNIEQKILNETADLTEIGLWLYRQKVDDPVMKNVLKYLETEAHKRQFYEMRCVNLEKIFREFPEPCKTAVCEILANGYSISWEKKVSHT